MRDNMPKPDLVDISTVLVEKNLPDKERYAEYNRQIVTPDEYISGIFTITAVHPNNGKKLEDCLRGIMD